jgi:hypothetical protein
MALSWAMPMPHAVSFCSSSFAGNFTNLNNQE